MVFIQRVGNVIPINNLHHRYSRKLIWLKLATTNNDPRVILLHYLLAVLEHKGSILICICVCMLMMLLIAVY